MKTNLLLLIAALIVLAAFVYYPKPIQTKTEATLSWDVSGYYLYLPAVFIYGDLKHLSFTDDLMSKYQFSGSFYQAYDHESGNKVMKYPVGLAVLFLPFFFLGHLAALVSGFPADGFSPPYQWAISLGGLMVSWVGLLVLFRVLREYYSDFAAAITLVFVVVASNYLNYAAIDHAMTHTWLFTLYALVMFFTMKWYKTFATRYALLLGLTIGLMTITRPTEIIALVIPVLWGVDSVSALRRNIASMFEHRKSVLAAIVIGSLVVFIQLGYWYYITGDFLVYSYQDQGFSWLSPHMGDGFFSFRKGWFIYTPFMLLLVPALVLCYKNKRSLFVVAGSFLALSVYITFSWDVWWYGGSIGQRALVQHYPVFILILPAIVDAMQKSKNIVRIPFIVFLIFCSWYNLHLTYIAHKYNAPFNAENMTRAYFLRTFGTTTSDQLDLKLLDTDEDYKQRRLDVKHLARLKFAQPSDAYETQLCRDSLGITLDQQKQFSPPLEVNANRIDAKHSWIRAIVHCNADQYEWEEWKMAQLVLVFIKDGEEIKRNAVRIHRQTHEGTWRNVWIDSSIPRQDFDRAKVFVWNAESQKRLCITSLTLESFQ